MVTLVYARPYAGARGMLRGGRLLMRWACLLLGMSVMISGNNLLVVYPDWNCFTIKLCARGVASG